MTNNIQIDSISCNNIFFKYKRDSILDDFNLALKPGDFIRISGFSMRGKTAVVNLLLGFLEPDKGIIFINNKKCGANERQVF